LWHGKGGTEGNDFTSISENCNQIVNQLNLEKGITKLSQEIQFETTECGGRDGIKISKLQCL